MNANSSSTPLLSVIVPVCNVERFLDKCMESIIHQAVDDIQVICINDGSTDSSLDILQRYASSDPRIEIIDKPNAGYGAAMNDGLDKARGKYLAILESDDFACVDGWKGLIKLCERFDLDVAKGCYWRHSDHDEFFKVHEQTDVHCPPKMGAIPIDTVFDPKYYPRVFWMTPSIWSCVYRRSYLVDSGIRFNETPGASFQDTGFFFQVWSTAKRAMIVDNAILHYRIDNSGSSSKSTKKVHAVRDEMNFVDDFLRENDIDEKFRQVFASLRYKTYLWNLKRIADEYADEFNKEMNADLLHDFKSGYFEASMFKKKDRGDYLERVEHLAKVQGDDATVSRIHALKEAMAANASKKSHTAQNPKVKNLISKDKTSKSDGLLKKMTRLFRK